MQLEDYLKERGIKLTFFAQKVGISRVGLYNFIKKKRIPQLNVIYRIEKETEGLVTLNDWFDKKKIEETSKIN